MLDLYCIGGAAVDLILEVSRMPRLDEKLFVEQSHQAAGGFIANTACAAARLGLRTAWGGYVGDDVFGQVILHDFKKFGVGINDVEIRKGASDYTVVMITPNGERTILVVPQIPAPPLLTDKMKESLKRTKIAYTTIYKPQWFEETARVVHNGGGRIAVDMEANTIKDVELAESMLAFADIVFTDEAGIEAFCGEKTSRESAGKVLELGPEMVIVTRASEGALVFTPEEFQSSGIFCVPAKDTTGAGDCFHAAFLCALLSGRGLQDCLRFAGAAAAIMIQSIGARNGLPTLEEVKGFIENNK